MGFCFRRKESVEEAVNRLGRGRIKKAREHVKQCRNAEAIHELRKEIKRLRALLRLVRQSVPKKAYRRQMMRLRKAAKHLSDIRDAHVQAAALKELGAEVKGRVAAGSLRQLRHLMQEAAAAEMERFVRGKAATKVDRL